MNFVALFFAKKAEVILGETLNFEKNNSAVTFGIDAKMKSNVAFEFTSLFLVKFFMTFLLRLLALDSP